MTIRETIQRMIGEKLPLQVVVGQVQSVDRQTMTCRVDVQNAPLRHDVRLRAVITGDEGVVVIPKENSFVLMGLIENRPESSFICGFTEITGVQIKIEATVLKIDNDGLWVETGDTRLEAGKDGFGFSRQNESLKGLLEELLDAVGQITVPTPAGPSGPPVNAAAFIALKARLTTLLKV